jgi:phosphoribosylglycinamide formyltransferase-1
VTLRIAVLASGSGTNLQALSDACATGYVDAEVVCVVTNKRGARVMARAAAAGIEGVVVAHKGLETEAVDEKILAELDARDVDLVCHAGYMRIRGRTYCKALEGRAMNVHPSLLPAFPGAHAIADAWEWGVKTSGVTVHLATEDLDMGPIVVQRAVDIAPDDTMETFERNIHLVEYAIYPKAVKLFAEDKLKIEGRTVTITEDVEDPPWSGQMPPGLREAADE